MHSANRFSFIFPIYIYTTIFCVFFLRVFLFRHWGGRWLSLLIDDATEAGCAYNRCLSQLTSVHLTPQLTSAHPNAAGLTSADSARIVAQWLIMRIGNVARSEVSWCTHTCIHTCMIYTHVFLICVPPSICQSQLELARAYEFFWN